MTLLLAGDLGGTKTLLALYRSDGDQLSCVARERYISAEWPHLGPMLQRFLADHNNNGAEVAADGVRAEAAGAGYPGAS